MLCDKIRNDSVLLGRKSYAESMSLWALKILEISCDQNIMTQVVKSKYLNI